MLHSSVSSLGWRYKLFLSLHSSTNLWFSNQSRLKYKASRQGSTPHVHPLGSTRLCIFLCHCYSLLWFDRNQKTSLDALAKRILGVTMDKSWRIRCSNWEAEQFDRRQIEYAMNDALVASHIFLRLAKAKVEKRKVLRTACISEDCINVEKNASGHPEVGLNQDETGTKQPQSVENSLGNNIVGQYHSTSIEEEPDVAHSIDSSKCRTTEDQEKCIENSNQEDKNNVSFANKRASSSGVQDSGSKICGKVLQNSGDSSCGHDFDVEYEVYNITADLSKWESGHDKKEGYLVREEVVDLLQDPFFCQRASSLCKGVIDLAFKDKKGPVTAKEKDNKKQEPGEILDRKPYNRGTIRQSPLYMNCMLAAPDGSRLCTLDRKKADWYIEKGIGKSTLFCLKFNV